MSKTTKAIIIACGLCFEFLLGIALLYYGVDGIGKVLSEDLHIINCEQK